MFHKVSVFLILLLFYCEQGRNKQENLTEFAIEDFEGKELEVDECFSQVKLLPLQLDANRMIGWVKDVCVMGDT